MTRLLRRSTSSPSLKPQFPSSKSQRTSQFLSMAMMAFVIGEQTSGIRSRSLRTETRNLKIQDFDVLRRPGRIHRESDVFDSLDRKLQSSPISCHGRLEHDSDLVPMILYPKIRFRSENNYFRLMQNTYNLIKSGYGHVYRISCVTQAMLRV